MASCNKYLSLRKKYTTEAEKFWLDDIRELYVNNNFIKFFPRYDMRRTEQLNAITRFCIYFIVLILIFDKNDDWLYLPITIIVLTVIFFNINKIDEKNKRKELDKILDIRKEIKTKEKEEEDVELSHDGEEHFSIDEIDSNDDGGSFDLQSGYYDSDGVLRLGNKTAPPVYNDNGGMGDSLYTMDEIYEYNKNTCRKPTNDNPFMNPNITDYNNEDPPPVACNVDDEEIKDDMEVTFKQDLFQNVGDIFERENSARQFYSVPNTSVPNNQVEFANWLYKVPPTCKENGSDGACLKYENLRFKQNSNPL